MGPLRHKDEFTGGQESTTEVEPKINKKSDEHGTIASLYRIVSS